MKFENKEDIIKFLNKDITMGELKEYCNKYISEGLEIGKKYSFIGIDKKYQDIHYIIVNNIKKGLLELCNKYNFDIKILDEIFIQYVWNLSLIFEYKSISIYEIVGRYNFKRKIRKNASVSNATFILEELPYFEFCNENIDDLSIKDFIIGQINNKRNKLIDNCIKKIQEYKNIIIENENEIKKLKNINLNISN